jgi:hypothetical protein
MLRHRLVATQADAGVSLRNLGAFVGGQLLYVTPPFLLVGWGVARWIHAQRRAPVAWLLWLSACVPGVVLAALCLWSRRAEPHWFAPTYLALCLAVAHAPRPRPITDRIAVSTGVAVIALAWLWVGTPLPARLMGNRYEARYDLSNDLYAWASGRGVLRAAVEDVRAKTGRNPVVAGPHYIVCAQALVALDGAVPVGCRTPEGDDFARWLAPERWTLAPSILSVSDDRFSPNVAAEFPARRVADVNRTEVLRGGRVVRTITVTRLDRSRRFADAR